MTAQPANLNTLPIKGLDWESLVPLVGRASRAVAKYSGIMGALTNPHLLLSPLTTQEAVLSLRIKGTQATLGDVLKFEAEETPKQESREADIQEILNSRETTLRQEHLSFWFPHGCHVNQGSVRPPSAPHLIWHVCGASRPLPGSCLMLMLLRTFPCVPLFFLR